MRPRSEASLKPSYRTVLALLRRPARAGRWRSWVALCAAVDAFIALPRRLLSGGLAVAKLVGFSVGCAIAVVVGFVLTTLLKQLGDQSVELKLIFTGVAPTVPESA
jgi:hypothetical protein